MFNSTGITPPARARDLLSPRGGGGPRPRPGRDAGAYTSARRSTRRRGTSVALARRQVRRVHTGADPQAHNASRCGTEAVGLLDRTPPSAATSCASSPTPCSPGHQVASLRALPGTTRTTRRSRWRTGRTSSVSRRRCGRRRVGGFIDFMFGQLRELLTDYGTVRIVWFDGGWERPGRMAIAGARGDDAELQPVC